MDNFFDDLKSDWKRQKAEAKPMINLQALLKKAETYKKKLAEISVWQCFDSFYYFIFLYHFLSPIFCLRNPIK
jgi:hypothetical protein